MTEQRFLTETPVTALPRTHRTHVQGLRALAVALVVLDHAGVPWFEAGFVGVDMFFVISGFVITLGLYRELNASGTLNLRRFYLRRFRRLTPALSLMLCVTVAVSIVMTGPFGVLTAAAKTALGATFFGANFVLAALSGGYFAVRSQLNPLLHTWSLSVEEQFYFVFPLLLWVTYVVARRLGIHRLRALAGFAAVATGVSFGFMLFGAQLPGAGPVLNLLGGYYGPLFRVWEFGLGVLIALAVPLIHRVRSAGAAEVCAVAGWFAVAASLCLVTPSVGYPSVIALLPTGAIVLFLLSGELGQARTMGWFNTRPLQMVGDASYSIYLWHWPGIVIARQVAPNVPYAVFVGLAVSMVAAWASYRFVEEPIRAGSKAATWRSSWRIFAACFLAPVVVVALCLVACRAERSMEPAQQLSSTITEYHPGHNSGCDTHVAPSKRSGQECVWNAGGERQVYLVGDSHADVLSTPLTELATEENFELTVSTGLGCPLVRPETWTDPGATDERNANCATFSNDTMAWLLSTTPGTVILAHTVNYWTVGERIVPAGEHLAVDRDAATTAYRAALSRTVAALRDAGHQVIVVNTVPMYWFQPTYFDPMACPAFRIASGDCYGTKTRQQYEDEQGFLDAVTADVIRTYGGQAITPAETLCPDGVCTTRAEGKQLYRDTDHLTIGGSLLLKEPLRAALAAQRVDVP